jgi:hypothetical protein
LQRTVTRTLIVGVASALVLASMGLPAAAKKKPKHGGKKPIGTIVSYTAGDPGTLSWTDKQGAATSAPVAGDVQVKLTHRGNHDGSGNPSNGDVEDLTAGTPILRLKLDDGTIDKIRVDVSNKPACEPDEIIIEPQPIEVATDEPLPMPPDFIEDDDPGDGEVKEEEELVVEPDDDCDEDDDADSVGSDGSEESSDEQDAEEETVDEVALEGATG